MVRIDMPASLVHKSVTPHGDDGPMTATALLAALVALAAGAAFVAIAASVLRRTVAAEREATVRASVDTVVAVAGDRLDQHVASGNRELELRSQAVDQQLDALYGELHRVTDAVSTLQQDRARQHGELVQSLAETARCTAVLSSTTNHLREALASPKARGQWGERMADDVLRLAGLVEGVNYHKQQRLPGGGVPDVTFLLPGELLLHMDVKFPVANYLKSLEAVTDLERASAESAFLRDVRQRISEVTGRGYVEPGVTVPYVLVFIPNESIYGFVHERDPSLIDRALRQQVVLCSPFTLFAVLAVIREAVEAMAFERASDEVLACLAGFGDQWAHFAEQLDVAAKRFDSAHQALDQLAGPRRRQLQRQLDHLDELRSRRGLADLPPGGEEVLGRVAACPAGSTSPPPSTTSTTSPTSVMPTPRSPPTPSPVGTACSATTPFSSPAPTSTA